MKERKDFVSNSSSSSFIVVETDGVDETENIKEQFSIYSESYPYHFPCQDYKHQFGWEWENTYEFGGKLNFIGIQLLDLYCMTIDGPSYYYKKDPAVEFERCSSMLKKVCLEKFGFCAELDLSLVKEFKYKDRNGVEKISHDILNEFTMYIDHQSSVRENENMDMFDSEETLMKFLSYDSSYISGGNDNEDPR